MTANDGTRELEQLRRRVDELEALVQHQQETLLTLVGETPPKVADATAVPLDGAQEVGVDASRIDRRRAFAYLAGATGVGAATLLSAASPAAAIDGQAILAGETESSQSITGLVATSAFAGPVLHVRKTNTAFDLYSSAVQGSNGNASEIGVLGLGTASGTTGVTGFAQGTNGVGVQGEASASGGRGGVFDGPQAAIQLTPRGSPPSRANNQEGDIVMDSQNSLWVCVGVAPARWRLLGGPSSAGALTMLSAPYRCYDSRASEPPSGGIKGKLTGPNERVIDVSVGGTVPTFATAALINLTATNTSATGFLSIYPNGTTWPGTSTINWSVANSVIANTTIVLLDSLRRVRVLANGSTDFLIDVIGFF
jgi:hypothetical protein